MACKHGLLRGSKFNMRHTTIIGPALPFVQFLKDSPLVKKISLGIITAVGSGNRKPGTVAIKSIVLPTAVRFKFRGGNSVQEFHVFGDNLTEIAALAGKWCA